MRLNLYWRGIDLIDVELHLFRHRDDDEPTGQPPVLSAAAHPVDVSRADGPAWQDDQPVVVFGFGR